VIQPRDPFAGVIAVLPEPSQHGGEPQQRGCVDRIGRSPCRPEIDHPLFPPG
jgi:hypothetical protein